MAKIAAKGGTEFLFIMQYLLPDAPDYGNLNTHSWLYCTHQILSMSWHKDFCCHDKPLHPNQLPSLDTDAILYLTTEP